MTNNFLVYPTEAALKKFYFDLSDWDGSEIKIFCLYDWGGSEIKSKSRIIILIRKNCLSVINQITYQCCRPSGKQNEFCFQEKNFLERFSLDIWLCRELFESLPSENIRLTYADVGFKLLNYSVILNLNHITILLKLQKSVEHDQLNSRFQKKPKVSHPK